MIYYKTHEEIEIMRQGGEKLKKAVTKLLPQIHVGMSTLDIDNLAEKLIVEEGAESSFKRVPGYKWSTCLPINEQVVHTPPSTRKLENGDVLTLDIGAYYKGFHTDWATTFIVGNVKNTDDETFLKVGKCALEKALKKVQAGNRLGKITKEIENEIYGNGYCILHELTGHGVGKDLHEDPIVPGILNKPVEKTMLLKEGMVLAIEVIYSKSTEEIAYEEDNDWSVITRDGSLSACFEETIAITAKESFILT